MYCTYTALITRALAVAIIFAHANAYSNPQRLSASIVSPIISDYGDWKHLDDHHYFGSTDNNDKDDEDSEISDASSISSLPLKRSGASRLCGNKLVEMIVKMCKGCVKPAGGKPVTAKRSILNVMKRSSLTDKCCIHRCTLEDMKSFCCD